MRLRYFIIILLLLLINRANSQYYIVGQDPASIKWRYIKTEHFKIIYPSNFEAKAQEVANDMEHVWNYDRRTLLYKPKLCPIILHNRTIEPNGFTMWAPRRIEFYTCPSQTSYTEDWLKQLCIHEYRHFVQMSKMNQGITKWLSYLLGEQGTGLVLGLYEPTWFMEGDAVSMETAYSNSGRGKLPSFEMELRAQVLGYKSFTFDKAIFGSYKDYVPDYYTMGYNIVAYTRKLYGSKVWDSTLNYIAKRPYWITPFNRALKNTTGVGKVKLYQNTIKGLDSLWRKQSTKSEEPRAKSEELYITHNTTKKYWKYKYSDYIDDDNIFAERSGLDDINRFVVINKKTGKEKIIYTPGLYSADGINITTGKNKPGTLTADNISVGEGYVAWSEKIMDKRWSNASYSVLKIGRFKNSKIGRLKVKQITHKGRIFAPAISPDGTKIIAVNVSEDNYYSLVLLDIKTGKEIKQVKGSYDDFYILPTWARDNRRIAVIALNNKGKRIDIINTETGKSRTILEPTFYDISIPKFHENYIFYDAPYSGIDNIYAIDTITKKVYQVTSSRYGADFIGFSKSREKGVGSRDNGTQRAEKIIYSDYSANGFDIVESDYNPSSWIPLENIKDNSIKLFKDIEKEDKGNLDNDTIYKKLPSKKYSKIGNLFDIHSWAPAYLDVNNLGIKPGASILSQNLLSTTVTSLGWYYNPNENHGRYFADVSYTGFYPVIDLKYEIGNRQQAKSNSQNNKFDYVQQDIKSDINLPLNFTTGKYFQFIEPIVGFDYTFKYIRTKNIYFQYQNTENISTLYNYLSEPSLYYELYGYNLLKTSTRDINPKWGQVIDINYAHNPFNQPFDTKDISSLFSAAATLYFPGIFNHHSFSIYGAYQYKNVGFNDFSDAIRLPYSFSGIYDKRIYMLSLAYKLPLFYPDFSIGPIAYIKRFTGGLFIDYATDNIQNPTYIYKGYGLEIKSDMHILRFIAPINLGVRAIYRPNLSDHFAFEFLYGINLQDI